MRDIAMTLSGKSSRRVTLARLGAVLVGASASTFIGVKTAAAAPPPRGRYGYQGCDGGCGTVVAGKCCWYWTDDQYCKTYRCCDRWDLSPTPCICRHFV